MSLRALAIAALVAAAAGCASKGPEQPKRTNRANALLVHVPADSPYVIGVLEPPPRAYVEENFLRRAPEVQRVMSAARDFARSHPQAMAELPAGFRVIYAAIEEIGPKLSIERLHELGLRFDGLMILYGIGWVPVVRLELADGERFRTTVEHVLARAGVRSEVHHIGELAYWRWSIPGSERFEVAAAIDGDLLVASLYPTATRDLVLAEIIGGRKPARNLAATGAMERMRKAHQFQPWMSGYVDATALGKSFLLERNGAARAIADALWGAQAGSCRAETAELLAAAPRLSFGVVHYDDTRFEMATVLETSRDTLERLGDARGWVPALSAQGIAGARAAFGAAMRPDLLMQLLTARTDALAEVRHSCPALRWVDELARGMRSLRTAVAFSPIANSTGINVVIDQFRIGEKGRPPDLEMFALIGTTSADELLRASAQLLSDPEMARVKSGEPPRALVLTGMASLAGPAFVARTDRAVGLSLGPRSTGRLSDLLGRDPGTRPPLLYIYVETMLLDELQRSAESLAHARVGGDPELRRLLMQMRTAGGSNFETVTITGDVAQNGFVLRMVAHQRSTD